jgi:alanyl-tRNA synthetase
MPSDSTDDRAAAEPYVTAFEAMVEDVDDCEVRLDQTHFYAEGGGQPADRGTLNGVDDVTEEFGGGGGGGPTFAQGGGVDEDPGSVVEYLRE